MRILVVNPNTTEAMTEAIAIAPRLIWLQEDVIDDAAETLARAAGIPFVMDRCLAVEHSRLMPSPPPHPPAREVA